MCYYCLKAVIYFRIAEKLSFTFSELQIKCSSDKVKPTFQLSDIQGQLSHVQI